MGKKKDEKSEEQRAESGEGLQEQNSQISNLESQISELNEALLRERADAANVRRRAEEDKVKLGSYYKALVVTQLVPVIDNFERAIQAADAAKQEAGSRNEEELRKGVEAIYKQFGDVLQKLDVERIKTVGEPFDPHTMEAVSAEEGDGDQEIVTEELQSGYKLGDELLRPAMVRVKS